MAKVLVVTSGKGGVGKTTSTAALGAALARTGDKVVVVDFDVGLRNLDLVMGAERRVVFDLINVVQGDAKLAQALIRDKRLENLSHPSRLPDARQGCVDGRGRRARACRTSREVRLGDLRQSRGHRARCHPCDAPCRSGGRCHQPGSFVGSGFGPHHRVAGFKDREGRAGRADGEAPAPHPLRSRSRAERGEMLKTEDILEILSIPLLGIIPESEEVLRASNVGMPVTLNNPDSAPGRAYFDAARRLKGELVEMTIPSDRKGLLGKIFGRRAA